MDTGAIGDATPESDSARFATRSLAESGVRVLDCEHKTPKFLDYGYPYIAIPNILDGRLNFSGVSLISHKDLIEWTRRTKPQTGDLIVTRRGRVGDSAAVPDGMECAIGQNLVILRSDGTQVDQRYLRWAMRGPMHQAQVEKWLNVGAVFNSLNVRDLPRFEIPVPPLPEQRVIAHILGTLDDKIELNRQMNQTLEQIAAALFTSWFVDFDPVRAKAEGRQPEGMDAETAALFPDRLVVSEIGEIPEGWKAVRLGECFTVGLGGAWGEDAPTERASVAVHCLRGIDCHGLAQRLQPTVPTRFLSSKQVAARELTPGVILVEGSGSFCGRSMIWLEQYLPLFGLPVMYSNFCKRFDPLVDLGQAVVAWLQVRNGYEEGRLDGFRTGTAFPNFDVRGLLSGFWITLPSEEVARAFLSIYSQLLRPDLLLQSETLAELRDALLPRLLSGQLRVPPDELNEETVQMQSAPEEHLVQSHF